MKRLYRLTPHHRLAHNPLFNFEVRRIRWGSSEALILRTSRRWLAIFAAIPLLVWLAALLRIHAYGDRLGLIAVFFLLVLSLLWTLIVDFASITSGLSSINREITAGRWNLLRLTPLKNDQLIAAKHGAAQARVWRWMLAVIGLRFAASFIAFVSLVIELVRDRSPIYPVSVEDILSLLVLITGCLLLMVEPWWRMRTVTALGVAISARVQQPTSAVLAAGGAIFALWLLQGFVAFALILIVSLVILPLALLEYTALQVTILSPLVFLALLIATVYGFYSILQTWGLRRAERWIAQANP